MKQSLIFIILLFFSTTPVFSLEKVEMKVGECYLYFTNERVLEIKSNNPNLISAQRIATYKSSDNQVLFFPTKEGLAEIQIKTKSGIKSFTVSIKNTNVESNDLFLQIDDIPGATIK